jgi:hypothetical protein
MAIPHCLKTGKVMHPNILQARKHVGSLAMTLGFWARAYKCPHCRRFHVTRKIKLN